MMSPGPSSNISVGCQNNLEKPHVHNVYLKRVRIAQQKQKTLKFNLLNVQNSAYKLRTNNILCDNFSLASKPFFCKQILK